MDSADNDIQEDYKMPKGKNQKMKLYRLYKILLHYTDDEHSLSLKEITSMLNEEGVTVDRRALYRDIRSLEELGLEVEGERRGQEYTYHVVKKPFELAELKLLVDAIQSSKFITARKSNELIKKLTDYASVYEAGQLNRQVIVAGRVKTMNESIYRIVDKIHHAIAENKQIRFQYMQWNLKKQLVLRRNEFYQISPWALTWDEGNYYLIAFDSKAGIIKHYRVDKMQALSVTDKPREGQEEFADLDLAKYTDENFAMNGGREEKVTIRFSNQMVGVMIDRFGKDISIKKVDSDHSETTVTVAISSMFFGWIAGLGADVEIVAPAGVRDEYKNSLEEILKNYL